MGNLLIKINNLSKKYEMGHEVVKALDNVSLEINGGEIVTILGPSGSGKSTLVNIIGGIDDCNSGEVIIADNAITKYKANQLTNYRRENIGFVFQFYNLIPNLNVYENIEVVSDICDNPLNIDDLLDTLNIANLAKRYPVELSGGQQQRVAIARAIVKNPKILLCDEPTGALDYKSSLEILKLLQDINKIYNTTILLITHNNSISSLSHRTIRLSGGKIVSNELNQNILSANQISW